MITGTNPSNIQERLCTDLLHLKVQGCVLSFGASHQTSHIVSRFLYLGHA